MNLYKGRGCSVLLHCSRRGRGRAAGVWEWFGDILRTGWVRFGENVQRGLKIAIVKTILGIRWRSLLSRSNILFSISQHQTILKIEVCVCVCLSHFFCINVNFR